MAKSTVSVPMRTRPAVTPPKGVTTKTPTIVINTTTLETPDKETIGLMMERHPNPIYRKAKLYGIQLMSKPRGRKPKQQEPDEQ